MGMSGWKAVEREGAKGSRRMGGDHRILGQKILVRAFKNQEALDAVKL